jgi:hypothetical protein
VVAGAGGAAHQVVERPEPVQDHATRRDLALSGDRQHFMDPAAELGVDDHLGEHATQRAVELEGGRSQLLARDDGNGEGVDVQLGGGHRDERDLHGALSVSER